MSNPLRLGLIGLDTSHVIRFAEILNDAEHPYHISGAKITAGFQGGSTDVEASYTRVHEFTRKMKENYGVEILSRPEEVAEACDAVLITSVDGRVHKEQFEAIVQYKKPVFIDKPMTCSVDEAESIYRLAAEHGIPLMSSSVLRYLEPLQKALESGEQIVGADCYCPLELEPTNPGWFWYGIHGVEMLLSILGNAFARVQVHLNEQTEFVVGEWADGRIGTIRGSLLGNYQYGATLHYKDKSTHITSADANKPMVVSLLERLISMFRTGEPDVAAEDTLAVLRFIEAINAGRK